MDVQDSTKSSQHFLRRQKLASRELEFLISKSFILFKLLTEQESQT